MRRSVNEQRDHILELLNSRIIFGRARNRCVQIFMDNTTFANMFVRHLDLASVGWRVTKAVLTGKRPRLQQTHIRKWLTARQALRILHLGDGEITRRDNGNLDYYAKLKDEKGLIYFSYCIDTKLLTLRFSFVLYRKINDNVYYI